MSQTDQSGQRSTSSPIDRTLTHVILDNFRINRQTGLRFHVHHETAPSVICGRVEVCAPLRLAFCPACLVSCFPQYVPD